MYQLDNLKNAKVAYDEARQKFVDRLHELIDSEETVSITGIATFGVYKHINSEGKTVRTGVTLGNLGDDDKREPRLYEDMRIQKVSGELGTIVVTASTGDATWGFPLNEIVDIEEAVDVAKEESLQAVDLRELPSINE